MLFFLDIVVKCLNMDGILFLEMLIFLFFMVIEINCLFFIIIKVIDLLFGVYLKVLESKLKIIFLNLLLFIYKKIEGNVV